MSVITVIQSRLSTRSVDFFERQALFTEIILNVCTLYFEYAKPCACIQQPCKVSVWIPRDRLACLKPRTIRQKPTLISAVTMNEAQVWPAFQL